MASTMGPQRQMEKLWRAAQKKTATSSFVGYDPSRTLPTTTSTSTPKFPGYDPSRTLPTAAKAKPKSRPTDVTGAPPATRTRATTKLPAGTVTTPKTAAPKTKTAASSPKTSLTAAQIKAKKANIDKAIIAKQTTGKNRKQAG